MTVDIGLYMPPPKSVTIYFIKDVLSKTKSAIKVADVKHLYAP